MIDQLNIRKKIVTKEIYKSDRINYFLHDDNREWISLLVYIYVDESVLSFVLIY